VVTFFGDDFGVGLDATGQYCATSGAPRCYNTTCAIATVKMLTCTVAPGYGAGLAWRVFIGGVPVPATTDLLMSYARPVIEDVVVVGGLAAATTAGGFLVNITG
jgi:hypothetical protein